MKKIYLSLTMVVLLAFSFIGCVGKKDINAVNNPPLSQAINDTKLSGNKEETPKYIPKDFLPNKLNLKLSYDGGFENGGEQSYIEYVDNNRVQIKTVSGGTSLVKVIESKEDSISIVYTEGELYNKKNMLSTASNFNEALLKAPIKVGTSWKSDDNTTKTITAVDMDLNTKAGNFKVVEVTKKGKDYLSKEYFAKGLGVIKTVFQTNGSEFITELKSIEENSPLKIGYRYFYYDVVNDKSLYKEVSFAQQEESKLKANIEENLRKVPSKNFIAIKPAIKINKIELIKDKALLHIDFSSNFVKEMNLGSGPETLFLQSIVNTLGYNYGVSEVMITLDGKPYSSGHIFMKNGETFKVGYENSVKIK